MGHELFTSKCSDFFTAACRRSIIDLDLNYSPIRSIFKLEYSSHRLEKDALIGCYSECPYNLTKHENKLENIHVNGREPVCALGLKMQMYKRPNLEYRSTPDVQYL